VVVHDNDVFSIFVYLFLGFSPTLYRIASTNDSLQHVQPSFMNGAQAAPASSSAAENAGFVDDGWKMVMVDKPIPFPRDHIDDNTVPDRLKCGISLQVMEEPATIVPCGHTFDNKCLEQHCASHQLNRHSCPTCRGPIQQTVILPDMKQLVRDTIKTRCIAAGCEAIMVINNLEDHLMKECQHIR